VLLASWYCVSIADSHDDTLLRQRCAEFEAVLGALAGSMRDHQGNDLLAAETRRITSRIDSESSRPRLGAVRYAVTSDLWSHQPPMGSHSTSEAHA